MDLQNKINKRIEELEEQLRITKEEFFNEDSVVILQRLDKELSIVEVCILELKQLLNN